MSKPLAFPISIKGVLVRHGKVLLLKNERDEWELPGGRIEVGETPEECVAREIAEETRCAVLVGPILDSWMYYIDAAEKNVFVVTYGCYPIDNNEPTISHEHREASQFAEHEIVDLHMPDGYKRSINAWFAHLRADSPELVR